MSLYASFVNILFATADSSCSFSVLPSSTSIVAKAPPASTPPLPSKVILTLPGAGGAGFVSFHTALTVTLSLAVISSFGYLSSAGAEPIFTDHLSNSLPAGAVNVLSGSLYLLYLTTSTATMLPSPSVLSNVIFTFSIGLSFHTALTVTLSLAVISSFGYLSSAGAEPIFTDHLSNSLPAGAVNVLSGSLYLLYLTTSTATMLPSPSVLSNVIFTFSIGLSFHIALTVTLSLAVIFSPGCLFTGAAAPTVTDHLSNSLSAGGVNVHAGST